jgi:2-amino-4-hydroxy-6-hydroxymethyldihydropteridine diphosphokinase
MDCGGVGSRLWYRCKGKRDGMTPQGFNSKDDQAILIGLGANLPSRFGAPGETIRRAIERLEAAGLTITARSRLWETAPVPVSEQPWYVNAVCRVTSDLGPAALLALLHQVEEEFGRVRTVVNAPRLLDLDLLAHGREVVEGAAVVPHPRLAERAFVLLPLQDVAPHWTHPVSAETLAAMIARLPKDQLARPQS